VRNRRLAVAALAATALVSLTGCGSSSLPPGAASVVDGHTITRERATHLAEAQCAGAALGAEKGQGQAVPLKQVTQRALGLLIDTQLNLDFGESLGLEPRQELAARDFAQVQFLLAALPAKYQSFLDDVFEEWSRGRDLIKQVGETATGATADDSNIDQILNAGYAKRDTWLKESATVDTDPRYAPGELGWPGEGDSSVSKPVSSFAKAASKSQPSAAFVAGLPAGQRCG
jgi:hypothetical protein